MPYIEQKDRAELDPLIENAVEEICDRFQHDKELIKSIVEALITMAGAIKAHFDHQHINLHNTYQTLALKIVNGIDNNDPYDIRMRWAGWLNYSVSRILVLLPKRLVATGYFKKEFAYWIYACMVGALGEATNIVTDISGQDDIRGCLVGVFTDIKDEYKWRVNRAYERVKIAENGDVFLDAPYYTED